MCAYCMISDFQFRHNPPWNPPYTHPMIPLPLNPTPVVPWDVDKLKEFLDLIKRVKDLEDQLGCPCEPNKADYLTLLRERIEKLESLPVNIDQKEPK